jgi:hypothetical protein
MHTSTINATLGSVLKICHSGPNYSLSSLMSYAHSWVNALRGSVSRCICLSSKTIVLITYPISRPYTKERRNQMKNKNYHTVRTFSNPVAKSIPSTPIYMTPHFPGLVQPLK